MLMPIAATQATFPTALAKARPPVNAEGVLVETLMLSSLTNVAYGEICYSIMMAKRQLSWSRGHES